METKQRRKKAVRRTPESYRKEVEELTNGEYIVLGTFIYNKTKIIHKHLKCGHEWEVVPNSFINKGRRCPKCNERGVRRTPDGYSREVSEITDGEYSVLGRFRNTGTKILHAHIECGYEWEVSPNNFIYSGSRCPKCARQPRLSPNEYRKEVGEITNGEYSVLGEYENATTKIEHMHLICGNVWEVSPSNFVNSMGRCLHCAGRYRMSDEEFKKRISDLVGGEYVFLEPFVTTHHPLKVVHKVCGYMYEVSPSTFIHRGSRCSNCAIEEKLENFKKRVYDLVGDEYTFLEPYKNNASKLEVRHAVCGHRYSVTPLNFLNGSRCPNCVYSRGEKAVADVLDSLSIEYSREHSFKYLGRKRYDFFIPSLNIAIEYDGEQHFKAVDLWGGEEALKRTQESDALKNDFCEYMGIDLLRIPYWEFDNIDEIVTNFIDTVKLMRSISDNSMEFEKCR